MPSANRERDTARVTATYREYDKSARVQRRRDPQNPGAKAMTGERSEALRSVLRSRQLPPRPVVVDVGCGGGGVLREVADELADLSPALYGLDLLDDRIRKARCLVPEAHTWVQSATQLPFADRSVDLVLCFTVLSSILDRIIARQIATEMWRVLAQDGAAIVYDMRYPSPRNRNVRPLSTRRLRHLFPAAELHVKRLTLLPPVARRLGSRTDQLYPQLVQLPVLRGHNLTLIEHPTVCEPAR